MKIEKTNVVEFAAGITMMRFAMLRNELVESYNCFSLPRKMGPT